MRLDAHKLYEEVIGCHELLDLSGEVFLSRSGLVDLHAIVKVDELLKDKVLNYIHWEEWCSRAKLTSRPILHLPVRYVTPGYLSNHNDVFLYFPHSGQKLFRDKIFGLEFLDTSEAIFNICVLPCLKEVFYDSDEISLLMSDIRFHIYIGSLLHEGLHQIGDWKMVPTPQKNIKLTGFLMACWGELAADTLIGSITKECYLPFLSHLLLKIFWYSRTSKDNDSWGGEVMLLHALESKLFNPREGKWTLDLNNMEPFIESLMDLLRKASHSSRGIVDDLWVEQIWRERVHQFSKETLSMKEEILQRCQTYPTRV